MKLSTSALGLTLLATSAQPGCGAPRPEADTGGVSLAPTACGRGLVVVATDYASSSIALADTTGAVVSASVLSSSSAAAGLGAPLSGDVTTPSSLPPSGRVVLLDRYPASVVTWLDPASGAVEGQLALSAGNATNPQDYLEIDDRRAYVTRYDSAASPQAPPLSRGSDVLVIDHRAHVAVSSIPLPGDGALLPRPTRLLRVGAQIVVPLERMDRAFQQAGDGAVVGIDPSRDEVAWTLALPGLASCGGAAVNAEGTRLVLVCSGRFLDGPTAQLARAGIAVLDTTTLPPTLIAVHRTPAPPSPFADVDASGALLVVTYGDRDRELADALVRVELATGATTELARSSPFGFGDVRCLRECGSCFVADAGAGELVRVADQHVSRSPVSSRGLPPRYLGRF